MVCAARKGAIMTIQKPIARGFLRIEPACCIAVNMDEVQILRARCLAILQARPSRPVFHSPAGSIRPQGGEDKRQGLDAGCDRKSRKGDACNRRSFRFRLRQAVGVKRGQIDNPANHGEWLERQAPDSHTSDLDQSLQLLRRPHQQLAIHGLHTGPIVGHQPGKRKQAGDAGIKQPQYQTRFSGTGRAANEHRPGADQDRRCMNGGTGHGQSAGRRTVKRAPSTNGAAPSWVGTPSRFSARILPPCASMICLEIDRPRPEFCPKPWCGRSV